MGEFIHNEYTHRIFNEFETGSGHVFIQARAGTGKTTSLIEMLNHFYGNINLYPEYMQNALVCFVAFSNEVKKDIDKRVPQGERVYYEKHVHNAISQILRNSYLDRVSDTDYEMAIDLVRGYLTRSAGRKGEVLTLLEETLKSLKSRNIEDADLCSQLVMEDLSDVHVKTFHGLGYGILRGVYEKAGTTLRLDNDKYHNIVRDFIKGKVASDGYLDVMNALKVLSTHSRLSLYDPTDKKLMRELAWQYDIDIDKKRPDLMLSVLRWLPEVMQKGEDQARDQGIIDYTDMIYLPIKWEYKAPTPYKLMFIDEAQDLSKVTRSLIVNQALDPKGRAFFIGDSAQAIFGFAGADRDSVRDTITLTKAIELPLDICYRCPTTHIEMAQKLVPSIKAHPKAQTGIIVCAPDDILTQIVKPGDMVLCRNTAPLFQKAIECLRAKIPARIRGRDLCENMITVLKKIEKVAESKHQFDYERLDVMIDDWAVEEIRYLMKREASEASIQMVSDKRETLQVCYKDIDAKNMAELIDGIRSLIPSNKGEGRNISAVEFSTVHRVKGLEAERIFILEPTKLPAIWEKQQSWQLEQEKNLLYVAITRSKEFLCILGSEQVWKPYVGVIKPTHVYKFQANKWQLKLNVKDVKDTLNEFMVGENKAAEAASSAIKVEPHQDLLF
jgi:superfamily I DNA/RNA helicase